MIPLSAFLDLELAAAALLAGWVLVARPGVGPRSVWWAALLAIVAFALGDGTPYLVRLIAKVPFGPYIALFLCVLPMLFFMLISAAWLIRALLGLFGSGGGGHRVRATQPAVE